MTTYNPEHKPDYSLLPPEVLRSIVAAFDHGVEKYARENYLHSPPDGENHYYAKALRHLEDWRMGEHLDPETSIPHLAKAVANLMILEHRRIAEGAQPVQSAVRSGQKVCPHGNLITPLGLGCSACSNVTLNMAADANDGVIPA